MSSSSPTRARSAQQRAVRYAALQAIVAAGLWLAFSGKFDALHLGYGVLSIAIVLVLTRHLRVLSGRHDWLKRLNIVRAVKYPFWLLKEIVLANIQVAKLVVSPRMDIDPLIIEFRLPIDCPVTKVTLGNSITLTPGTLTLLIDGDRFLVHAINRESAGSLFDGTMQRNVAAIFGNVLTTPIEVVEVHGVCDPDADSGLRSLS